MSERLVENMKKIKGKQLSEENPLVTVAIAAYNVEKFLEKGIASVQKQTYKNLEILIVDDGSTDLTPLLCVSGFITLASRQIRLTIGQKIAAIQQPASCHTSMLSSSQEKKVIVRLLFRKVLSILHSWDSLRRHREILFSRQNTLSVQVWKQFTHL